MVSSSFNTHHHQSRHVPLDLYTQPNSRKRMIQNVEELSYGKILLINPCSSTIKMVIKFILKNQRLQKYHFKNKNNII